MNEIIELEKRLSKIEWEHSIEDVIFNHKLKLEQKHKLLNIFKQNKKSYKYIRDIDEIILNILKTHYLSLLDELKDNNRKIKKLRKEMERNG